MFDAVAVVGPGYKVLTYDVVKGPILQNDKKYCIVTRLVGLKK